MRRLFEVHHNPNLYYHNLKHTLSVVKSADLIAEHYQLNEEDMLSLRIAAWFHDAGYLFETPPLHEGKQFFVGRKLLKGKKYRRCNYSKVKGCIMATKLPQSLLIDRANNLRHADLFNLGTDMFRETGKMMRKETEAILDEKKLKAGNGVKRILLFLNRTATLPILPGQCWIKQKLFI